MTSTNMIKFHVFPCTCSKVKHTHDPLIFNCVVAAAGSEVSALKGKLKAWHRCQPTEIKKRDKMLKKVGFLVEKRDISIYGHKFSLYGHKMTKFVPIFENKKWDKKDLSFKKRDRPSKIGTVDTYGSLTP